MVQAAQFAEPGCTYKVDCLPCVDAFHKGRKWATSDRRAHARVHGLMFAAFDGTPSQSMVWMPAHLTEEHIQVAVLGDASLLTEVDLRGNARADQYAKSAVEAHRVPLFVLKPSKNTTT